MAFWIQLSAGQGPAECQWVVAQAQRCFLEEAQASGHKAEVIDVVAGDTPGVMKSVLIRMQDEALNWASSWVGTVLWRGQSTFRPHHKRKNWFIGVHLQRLPESVPWTPKDVQVQTFRSSGPGGQHANKADSAVRVTHTPTGLVAQAQEERSQRLNKQLALMRLAALIDGANSSREKAAERERWSQHHELERGNPVRTYTGPRFRLKK